MTLPPICEISEAERSTEMREAEMPSNKKAGFTLNQLPVGTVLEVVTAGNTYRIENRGAGVALISGHPRYCPEPVHVLLTGPIQQDSGLVFEHPRYWLVATSPVREIHQLN
jgi:hypothetical protein